MPGQFDLRPVGDPAADGGRAWSVTRTDEDPSGPLSACYRISADSAPDETQTHCLAQGEGATWWIRGLPDGTPGTPTLTPLEGPAEGQNGPVQPAPGPPGPDTGLPVTGPVAPPLGSFGDIPPPPLPGGTPGIAPAPTQESIQSLMVPILNAIGGVGGAVEAAIERQLSAITDNLRAAQTEVAAALADRLAPILGAVTGGQSAVLTSLGEALVQTTQFAAEAIRRCPALPPVQSTVPLPDAVPSPDPPGAGAILQPPPGQCVVAPLGPGGGVTVNVLPAAPAVNVAVPPPAPAPGVPVQPQPIVVGVPRPGAPAPPAPGFPPPPEACPPENIEWAVWFKADTCSVVMTRWDAEAPGAGFVRVGLHRELVAAAAQAEGIRRSSSICFPPPASAGWKAPDNPWDSLGICAESAALAVASGQLATLDLARHVGLRREDGTDTYPPGLDRWSVFGIQPATVGVDLWRALLDSMSAVVQGITAGVGPGAATTIGTRLGIALAEIAERWLGLNLSDLVRPGRYRVDYHNPSILPTPDAAAGAYLADEIDLDTAVCWARAQGRLPTPYRAEVAAAQSRHTAADAVALWRRGVLTEEQRNESIRRVGWLSDRAPEEWKRLTEALPGLSDIIRMMVRDVADPAVFGPLNLDAQFEDKFQGELKEWARAQGIEERVARYAWRAHWTIPSPMQLYQMLHRLSNLPAGDPAKVDRDDVKRALVQQDILPHWIEPLLAIAFRPLTRVDVRRAFDLGVLPEESVKRSYLDLGYSEANADTLAKFARRERRRRAARDPVVRSYAAGGVTRAQAAAHLVEAGYSAEDVEFAIGEARAARKRRVADACTKGAKRRYLRAALTDGEAQAELVRIGHDGADAADLVAGWSCERAARGKDLSAAQVCELRNRGILTPDEQIRRLQLLGYPFAEAAAVADLCGAHQRERDAAAAERQAREAAAERDRAVREARRRAKEAQSLAAAAERERKREEEEREKRDIRFLRIVAAAAKRAGRPEEELISELRRLRAELATRAGGDEDLGLEAMKSAVGLWNPAAEPSLRELAFSFFSAPRPV